MPHVTIPATHPARPRARQSTATRRPQPTARILLVEDEPVTAEVFARALHNDGNAVRVVRDGIQALHALRDEVPDLLVLDLGLPTLSGLEVLRRLREGAGPDLPVVVISGTPPNAVHGAAALLTPGRWLEKPLRPRELVAVVHELRAD